MPKNGACWPSSFFLQIFWNISGHKKSTFCSLFGFSDVNNAFDVTLNVPILSAVREAQKCLSWTNYTKTEQRYLPKCKIIWLSNTRLFPDESHFPLRKKLTACFQKSNTFSYGCCIWKHFIVSLLSCLRVYSLNFCLKCHTLFWISNWFQTCSTP